MNVSIHKIAAVHHALRVADPREAASIINASKQGAGQGLARSTQSQAHHGYIAAHRRLVNIRNTRIARDGSSPI